jgi:Fe-S cluster assembly iron-binding protein IscA
MITVTNSAKQHLKDALLANTDDPAISLRLVAKPGGKLGFMLDAETEGDQVVEHKGTRVLLVGEELLPVVTGLTLDVRDTAEGSELFLSRE